MNFHDNLKLKIHCYVKYVYRISKNFPREELYGITSQLRRSSISVILNYIEGYARRKGDNCKVYKNFLEIAYGSLKESKYLIYFAYSEKYLAQEDYDKLIPLEEEIGGMIWGIISKIKSG